MDQVEQLKKTLIEKNNEIIELRKLMKAGVNITAEKTTLERCLWAVAFTLMEKHVKCEKCGGKTRPTTMKSNYVMAACSVCGHLMDIKRSKSETLSAYWNEWRRAAQ